MTTSDGTPGSVDILAKHRDTFTITVVLQTSAGVGEDHATSTWSAMLRTSLEAATVAATFTIDETNDNIGVVVCTLAKATVAALTPGVWYSWDLVETAVSTAETTVAAGRVMFGKRVTHA